MIFENSLAHILAENSVLSHLMCQFGDLLLDEGCGRRLGVDNNLRRRREEPSTVRNGIDALGVQPRDLHRSRVGCLTNSHSSIPIMA